MTDPDPTPPSERPVLPAEPPKSAEPLKPATLKASLPPPGMPRPAAAPPPGSDKPAVHEPPIRPSTPAPTHSPRHALPIFTAIGFLCLAAAVFYLWQTQHDEPPQVDPARIASLEGQTRDLRARLATFDQRLATIEQRPATGGTDLRPLEARLAALESRPLTPSSTTDLSPIESRLAAAERIARLQAASLALEAGLPLGPIPPTPPALARYATIAPPTLATLRATFPEIARLARAASHPAAAATWSDRLGQTLSGLVTIRRGNDVLIGAAASAVLATAQDRLDAADIPGALAALDALDPAAAAIADPWKAEARALLAARAALAALARP